MSDMTYHYPPARCSNAGVGTAHERNIVFAGKVVDGAEVLPSLPITVLQCGKGKEEDGMIPTPMVIAVVGADKHPTGTKLRSRLIYEDIDYCSSFKVCLADLFQALRLEIGSYSDNTRCDGGHWHLTYPQRQRSRARAPSDEIVLQAPNISYVHEDSVAHWGPTPEFLMTIGILVLRLNAYAARTSFGPLTSICIPP